MKEAAGEANLTVITIVLIAIVLAVGTVIVNQVLTTTAKSSACSNYGGQYKGGRCNVVWSDGKTYGFEIERCYDKNSHYSKNKYFTGSKAQRNDNSYVDAQCSD